MTYSVTCECGTAYPVSPTAAGLPIDCRCGRSFYIPALSKLREAAGESPIPLNTIELIEQQIHNGHLPDGDTCPYSGRPADETVYFHVQCESEWTENDDSDDWTRLLSILFFGRIARLVFRSRSRTPQEFGRDTFIEVPVRIAEEFRDEVLRLRNQSKLKSLLRKTPLYDQLLREYPEAQIVPCATPTPAS